MRRVFERASALGVVGEAEVKAEERRGEDGHTRVYLKNSTSWTVSSSGKSFSIRELETRYHRLLPHTSSILEGKYITQTLDEQKNLKFSTAEERTAEVERLTEELSIPNGYMRMLWVRYDDKVRLLSSRFVRVLV